MAEILFIRHAATAWNAEKRLQGRADIPLSASGLASLQGKSIPDAFEDASWFCSPLSRARQTAGELLIDKYHVEPALIEMDWGDWEGQRVSDLRRELGDEMLHNEALGLDLLPPGGESPRQVMARLQCWLASLWIDAQHADGRPRRFGAVCHKGVIRVALALATGWDMTVKCPIKVDWNRGLRFELLDQGGLRLLEANVSLESTKRA